MWTNKEDPNLWTAVRDTGSPSHTVTAVFGSICCAGGADAALLSISRLSLKTVVVHGNRKTGRKQPDHPPPLPLT